MSTAKDPGAVAQRQLDAYSARDLPRFLAEYCDDVRLYRPPAADPTIQGKAALAAHYANQRFNLPGLHAELVNRMVFGNKVIDHEPAGPPQGEYRNAKHGGCLMSASAVCASCLSRWPRCTRSSTA